VSTTSKLTYVIPGILIASEAGSWLVFPSSCKCKLKVRYKIVQLLDS
jgi:hypothetical protein